MTILDYAPPAPKTHSRWAKAALLSSIAACLLFQLGVLYGRIFVAAAYAEVGKSSSAPLAVQHAVYDHYSNLKAVAVTVFLITLTLLAASLVASLAALCRRGHRKSLALLALLVLVMDLTIIATTR